MAAKTFEQFREETLATAAATQEDELRRRFEAQNAAERAAAASRKRERERVARVASLRGELEQAGNQVADTEEGIRRHALTVFELAQRRAEVGETISRLRGELAALGVKSTAADALTSYPWGATISVNAGAVAVDWLRRAVAVKQAGRVGTMTDLATPLG